VPHRPFESRQIWPVRKSCPVRLLIENASGVFLAFQRTPRPKAFPIKASDYTLRRQLATSANLGGKRLTAKVGRCRRTRYSWFTAAWRIRPSLASRPEYRGRHPSRA
jgi:hypothetical protein